MQHRNCHLSQVIRPVKSIDVESFLVWDQVNFELFGCSRFCSVSSDGAREDWFRKFQRVFRFWRNSEILRTLILLSCTNVSLQDSSDVLKIAISIVFMLHNSVYSWSLALAVVFYLKQFISCKSSWCAPKPTNSSVLRSKWDFPHFPFS